MKEFIYSVLVLLALVVIIVLLTARCTDIVYRPIPYELPIEPIKTIEEIKTEQKKLDEFEKNPEVFLLKDGVYMIKKEYFDCYIEINKLKNKCITEFQVIWENNNKKYKEYTSGK